MKFHKIIIRNFGSVGNYPLEFVLDKHPITLFSGKNGSGKSTLCEALTFAAYGCSYRNVNKNMMVNKANGKNCVVELFLTSGSRQFRIVRGMKPNILEVYQDGSILQIAGDVREQQKYIEDVILKMSYSTFCQIVILGSANYVPFMRLDAAKRRGLMDSLLNLSVFTEMQKVLKAKYSLLEDQHRASQMDVMNLGTKIDYQKKIIAMMAADHTEKKAQIKQKILEAQTKLSELEKRIEDQKSHQTSIKKDYDLYEQLGTEVLLSENELSSLKKQLERTRTNKIPLECSECQRPFESHDVDEQEKIKKEKVFKLEMEIDAANDRLKSLGERRALVSHNHRLYVESVNLVSSLTAEAKVMAETGMKLVSEFQNLKKKNNDSDTEQALLDSLSDQLTAVNTDLIERQYKMDLTGTAIKMLKDDGIKASIVKQFIPVFNQSVMKYLSILNFEAKFEMNEDYEDKITINGVDVYEYNQLSMGERTRIDLAVMFSWRDIAIQHNSANCNLLIFDEILESAVDNDGIDFFVEILHNLPNTNSIVISHKPEQLTEQVDCHIMFAKRNGFTEITTT